jgi:hypothetical protein
MRRVCLGFILLAAGCQKTDTETLSRIGRRVADRGSAVFSDLRGRIDLKWKPPEPNLEEQIRLRMRYDRDLADCAIEIKVEGKAVTLRGKVATAEQKRKAADLADATRGVEMVEDHIQVLEAAPPSPMEPPPEEKKQNGDE